MLNLWQWDTRPHGWTGSSFGPLADSVALEPEPEAALPPKPAVIAERERLHEAFAKGAEQSAPRSREELAATALLAQAQRAEARRHVKRPIDPWRTRR